LIEKKDSFVGKSQRFPSVKIGVDTKREVDYFSRMVRTVDNKIDNRERAVGAGGIFLPTDRPVLTRLGVHQRVGGAFNPQFGLGARFAKNLGV